MQVNSINNYNCNKNNKINFGSVIPFRVKLNGVIISQSADNQDMMKSVSYKIARLIGGTTELGTKIKSQLQGVDKAFDGTFRTIRRGTMKTVFDKKTSKSKIVPDIKERFFATGADAVCADKTGYQIGCKQRSDASRAINLDNENNLCNDSNNRIKGLKEIIVNITTSQKKKGTSAQTTNYKIEGIEIVKDAPAVTPKKQVLSESKTPEKAVQKEVEPLTEGQMKIAKAGKRAQKKTNFNPNQEVFAFVPEIEKAQESKEIREAISQMWANH